MEVESMKNIDAELIEWAKRKINTKYPEDIALLIGQKGACKLPDDEQTMAFDYFIPSTERGYQMSKTFVIEDMGYDLYPISYDRLTAIANLEEPNMISVLEKGEILYAKDQQEENKFLLMKEVLYQNLSNQDMTYRKALEYLHTAMEIFSTLVFEEKLYKIRKAAGGISSFLLNAIALMNGTYLTEDYGNLTAEFNRLKNKPEQFRPYYYELLSSNDPDEIKEICKNLIKVTREFFWNIKESFQEYETRQSKETESNANYEDLAFWYQEARYTFRKISYYAQKKQAEQSFSLGCYLQIEFDAIRDEFALKEMDLLGSFCSEDLSAFEQRAQSLEQYIRDCIVSHGVTIQEYRNLTEFLEKDAQYNEV